MRRQQTKRPSAIPTVQNYDRKKKEMPPAKNDQKLNKKRHVDQSEQENSTPAWKTPDPKGGNL